MQSTLYRIRRPLDLVCVLSAGALLMLGPSIVRLMYDARYADAGWMLGVLSLTLLATRLDVFDQCLIATGRVRLLSLVNASRLVALYAVVPLGYWLFGSTGAVSAVGAVAVVNACIVIATQRRLGLLDLRRELLAIPLFAAGVAAGWLAKALLDWIR